MDFLKVDTKSKDGVIESFDKMAKTLFCDYQLQVNNNYYRLIDIEFYYISAINHEDVYTHGADIQAETGRWYFHDSGIDITIGNGEDRGGILIRAIAKLNSNATSEKNFIENEVHGPLKVKDEIVSHFNGPFEGKPTIFQLNNIIGTKEESIMLSPKIIAAAKRIGLKSKTGHSESTFLNKSYRYVMFWDNYNPKYKDREAIVRNLLFDKKIDTEFAKKILNYNITK